MPRNKGPKEKPAPPPREVSETQHVLCTQWVPRAGNTARIKADGLEFKSHQLTVMIRMQTHTRHIASAGDSCPEGDKTGDHRERPAVRGLQASSDPEDGDGLSEEVKVPTSSLAMRRVGGKRGGARHSPGSQS